MFNCVLKTYYDIAPLQLGLVPLLKCADCGTLVQEDKTSCGFCRSTQLYPSERTIQPVTFQLRPADRDRTRLILVLVVGAAIFTEGAALAILPILPGLTVVGFFLMLFGAVVLLAVQAFSAARLIGAGS